MNTQAAPMKPSKKEHRFPAKTLGVAVAAAIFLATCCAPGKTAVAEPLTVGESYFSLATSDLRDSFRQAVKRSESRSNIRKIANGAVAAPKTVNTLAKLTPKSSPAALSAR